MKTRTVSLLIIIGIILWAMIESPDVNLTIQLAVFAVLVARVCELQYPSDRGFHIRYRIRTLRDNIPGLGLAILAKLFPRKYRVCKYCTHWALIKDAHPKGRCMNSSAHICLDKWNAPPTDSCEYWEVKKRN